MKLPRILLLSSTLFLASSAGAQAALQEPGFVDNLVGNVPSPSSNHYGAIVVDAADNLYVVGGLSGVVYRGTMMGGFASYITTPFQYALSLALDGNTLYVGGSNPNEIRAYDITAPATPGVLLTAAAGSPQKLELACNGYDLVVATNSGIRTVDLGTGVVTTLTTGVNTSGMDCHWSGNSILHTDYDNDQVLEVTGPGASSVFYGPILDAPDALIVHPSTNFIYVGCSTSDQLWKLDPTGTTLTLFADAINFDGGTWPTPVAWSRDATKLYYGTTNGGSYAIRVIEGFPGLTGCSWNAPAMGATVSGGVTFDFDADDGDMDPVTATFEFSTDSGATWILCTAGPSSPQPNPSNPIATPATSVGFVWDSTVDGVGLAVVQTTEIRISVTDGVNVGTCLVQVMTDNVPPPPTCSATGPAGIASGDVLIDLDTQSPSSAVVDTTLEFSTDGGSTWALCTPGAGAPFANPAVAVPTGMTPWPWDSRADGVALAALLPGVLVSLTVDDGVSPTTTTCTTAPFDVDNTMLCFGICGDCDQNGLGPNILDSLEAAKIAAALVVPTAAQAACCDVNVSSVVDVIDALFMAQFAAGLPSVLTCI